MLAVDDDDDGDYWNVQRSPARVVNSKVRMARVVGKESPHEQFKG